MQWPNSVVRAYAEYLSKEPSPDEKLEYMLAYGIATYCNANRKKGSPASPITDFMLFKKVWKTDDPEDSEEETNLDAVALMVGAKIKRR